MTGIRNTWSVKYKTKDVDQNFYVVVFEFNSQIWIYKKM